ncbi:MAG TPA: hypothetical protein VFR91_08485 [Dyella sp.]|nr:hypothetical protein [Dyella sp.]
MPFAPHLLRRSPRLWALGLLAWLALALQAAVALPAGAPVPHHGAGVMATAAMPHHPATTDAGSDAAGCCGTPAAAHCACPAACTAAVPTLPEGWMLAALPPPSGPVAAPSGAAPQRFPRPPLRPPMA